MSEHQFTAHIQPGVPPVQWYAAARCQPGFQSDPAQAAAIDRLQHLFDELVDYKRKKNRLFAKTLLPDPPVPRGLYFWGGVGRGKSFLMDGFFACMPYRRKRRMHFHAFMQEVHASLNSLKSEADPLAKVAAHIATKTCLLCFDEFHVSDIADAMILGRLFTHLFRRGVILVATSNYAPDALYPNGLQRQNFLPTIALLKAHVDVVNVDGGNDYRSRWLEQARTYLTPLSADTHAELDTLFTGLTRGPDMNPRILIDGRELVAERHAAGVIWFSFKSLCETPRSQTDYLWLARRYGNVIISEVPKLGARDASAARRLTWLVDVFYDCRVKLILSAAVPVDALYAEGPFAQEFFRTASRLTEMQSTAYLALAHEVSKMPEESVSLPRTESRALHVTTA